MKGYQLTFFTVQDRKHGRLPLCEWLMNEIQSLGSGATLVGVTEGFGHGHKMHSAHFIELADQLIEIKAALSSPEADI